MYIFLPIVKVGGADDHVGLEKWGEGGDFLLNLTEND